MTEQHKQSSATSGDEPRDWFGDLNSRLAKGLLATVEECPRPVIPDHSAHACVESGNCGCGHNGSSAGSEAENWARLGASEYACYRWPEDTAEHRAMRAAFMDGAAHAVTRDEPQAAWQPIETAPKDQCILVAAAHRLRPHRIAWWSERQFAQHGNGWAFDGDGFITPLAWQPLPDASQVTRPNRESGK